MHNSNSHGAVRSGSGGVAGQWCRWAAGRCVVLCVLLFLLFQLLFLFVVFSKHSDSLFADSLRDIQMLTRSAVRVLPSTTLHLSEGDNFRDTEAEREADRDAMVEHREPEEAVRRRRGVHSDRIDEAHRRREAEVLEDRADVHSLQPPRPPYTNIFPVAVLGEDSEGQAAIPPRSREIVENLLGEIVPVDFPDLMYRSPSTVRQTLPKLFHELPQYGFDPHYKNPCWTSLRAVEKVCLPYAYILGQPKCGTSDLFERIKSHQDVVMPKRKEVRWFTRGEFTTSALSHEGEEEKGNQVIDPDAHIHERLIGSDTSIFSFTRSFAPLTERINSGDDAARKLITVDGGPHTLWWPTQNTDGAFLVKDIPAPQLIREMQPQAKFLITLCDPVKRLYSDYYFLEDNLRPVRPGSGNSKSAEIFHKRVVEQIEGFNECVDIYFESLSTQYRRLVRNKVKGSIAISLKNKIHQDNVHLWFRASQICAHDRKHFAVGGWGRISIGLYVLFLEKWLEHFDMEQFLVVRLEDYDLDPQGYLLKVFRFLQLSEPKDWLKTMKNKRFNEHRIEREPILEKTELLLREFYRPYNQLLVEMLKNPNLGWEGYVSENETFSLREVQLHDLKLDPPNFRHGKHMHISSEHILLPGHEEDEQGGERDARKNVGLDLKQPEMYDPEDPEASARVKAAMEIRMQRRPPVFDPNDQHSVGRLMHKPHLEDLEDDNLPHPEAHLPPGARQKGQLRGGTQDNNSPLTLRPKAFSVEDLPPAFNFQSQNERFVELKQLDVAKDPVLASKKLCEASFTLNIAHLKYLLYDLGIPSNIVNGADANRNAWHCLASVFTLGDAHAKSQVFAELKGKESWLTQLFDPPLPKHVQSLMSRDVVEHLATNSIRVAKWLLRAQVPIDAQDNGGHTPLHLAAIGGERDLVDFLLINGADPNILSIQKRSPLHFAAALGHAEVVNLLLLGGAIMTTKDINEVSAFDIISNPGPITQKEALQYANITQRPTKLIERVIHPELYKPAKVAIEGVPKKSVDDLKAWKPGSGGWNTSRLTGFESDMDCNIIDQYYAHEISASDIYFKYLARNAPVLIRGLLDDWAINTHFTVDNLRKDHGNMTVTVSDIPYSTKFGGAPSVTMTLADYITSMFEHRVVGGNHPWYVFKGHPIPLASEREDSLVPYSLMPTPWILQTALSATAPRPTKPTREFFTNPEPEKRSLKEREIFVNAQWAFGSPGTGAPIHFHNTAWSALLVGAKKWMIYSPHNMIMSNKQILDFIETDKQDFSKRNVEPLTCVQTAGDAIIIPESWGHGVLNIQDSIAVASELKYSMWRLKPGISTVGIAPAFDNKAGRRGMKQSN